MERDLVYDTILTEIGRLGGKIDGVRPAKGGHRLIYWTTADGGKVATTAQRYTGNWRSVRHARSTVRRAAQLVAGAN